MKKLLGALLFATTAIAQTTSQLRPVHTYSIVARDPQTGEMGVAVQSHWFNVGSVVPWAEAGVGAVATQSFVDPSYGEKGLQLMSSGASASEALRILLQRDKAKHVRQVAFVDATGRTAVWTGCNCISEAGHVVGPRGVAKGLFIMSEQPCPRNGELGTDFSVQANLMANDKVWPAMAKAYEETKGDLASRMLAALDAAQAAGGDARGRQSAALIVVKAKSSGKPWQDRVFDIRVDDHAEPLKELRRLVTIQRAYNHMNAGDLAVEHKDNAAALREYSAAEKLIQGVSGVEKSRIAEISYWHAVALVNMGKVDESLPLFKKAFALHPAWRELTKKLPKSELLPNDEKMIGKIVAQ